MNWLLIAVIAVLVLFTIIGYVKGFINMLVGIVAMALAMFGSYMFAPVLKDVVVQNTSIRTTISDTVKQYLEEQVGEKLSQVGASAQESIVGEFEIPDNLKELILKNNDPATYIRLGVNSFEDYVCNIIADFALSALCYLIAFLVIYIALRVVFILLNVVAKLPVLKEINKTAGAVLGAAHALVYIWVFFAAATAAINTGWGMSVMTMIGQSKLLTILYQYNFVYIALTSMIK